MPIFSPLLKLDGINNTPLLIFYIRATEESGWFVFFFLQY